MPVRHGRPQAWIACVVALLLAAVFVGAAWAGQTGDTGGVPAGGVVAETGTPSPQLDISKTAKVELEETWGWWLEKTVDGDGWYLFRGDRGESKYTIAVKRTGPEVRYRIWGTITVENPTHEKASVVAVVDELEGIGYAPVTCSRYAEVEWTEPDDRMVFGTDGTMTLPDGTVLAADGSELELAGLALHADHAKLPPAEVELEPYDRLHCWYGPVETSKKPTKNTAKVITRGDVLGDEVTIDVDVPEAAEARSAAYDLTVVDDYGTPKNPHDDLSWPLSEKPIAYKRWFSCADAGGTVNTARLLDKWGTVLAEDTAEVHVACYDLQVEKNAYTAFDRTFVWSIGKWVDPEKLELWNPSGDKGWDPKGGWPGKCDPKDPKKGCPPPWKADVDYKVKVWADVRDSGFRAWGTIAITNTHPKRDAYVKDVRDVLTAKYGKPIAAEVDCDRDHKSDWDGKSPIRIAPGATLECEWYATLPDAKTRWNTAYVDLKNVDFPSYGKPVHGGVTTFEGKAEVDFEWAKIHTVDEKVVVKDSLVGMLGTVRAKDAPAWFRYRLTFAPGKLAPVCGEAKVGNTAWFKTHDTGTTGEASAWVWVRVRCPDPKKPEPPKVDPKGEPKGDPKPKYDPPASPKPEPPKYDDANGGKHDDVICVDEGHKRGDRHDLAWRRLGALGLKTPFFTSGLTWWQVLKLAPYEKRAYFRLARAYIHAKLWVLAGADVPGDVASALAWADGHFAERGPGEPVARTAKAKRKVQRAMGEHGETLAGYSKWAKKHCG